MIFTYIVLACTVLLGLFALANNFPLAPIYALAALAGLSASYAQYRFRRIPFLRVGATIMFLVLTIQAILPFFAAIRKQDMFMLLVQTWIYFLLIQTSVIYVKRDYYIVQVLSLGLLIYACFFATNNPLVLVGYIIGFLVFWIMGLRMIGFLPEDKEEKSVVGGAANIYREFKLGALLFLAAMILSLPFYFLTPRSDIPLLPPDLEKLLQQRYSAIYADFPKRGLLKFLSKNPKKYTTEPATKTGETPTIDQKMHRDYQIIVSPAVTKPIIWHSAEIDALLKKIEDIKNLVIGIGTEHNLVEIPRNVKDWQELLNQQIASQQYDRQLEKQLNQAKDDYLRAAASQSGASAEGEAEISKQMERLESQMQSLVDARKGTAQSQTMIDQGYNEIRSSVYEQAKQSTQQLRVLWDRKEELENQLKEKLIEPPPPAPEEPKEEKIAPAKQADIKKDETEQKKEKFFEHITILDIFLYSLLLLILFYLAAFLFTFIVPFVRQRSRIRAALRVHDYNLAIALLYNFCARVLALFGLRYPVVILPEQYLVTVIEKYGALSKEAYAFTGLFIEARYSFHALNQDHWNEALNYYRAILREAQVNASLHQKHLVWIKSLFEF